jgi:hypothetical protein
MDLYVPSVPEQYGVNVNTVRKAVGVLEAEGLVTPVRRRGTVVRDRPPMKRLGTDRYAKSKWKFGLVAFAADREASGQTWKRDDQTNTVREVLADNDVAEALGVEPGAPVYERARLVKQDGTPTHTLTSYYRPEHVENTPIIDHRLIYADPVNMPTTLGVGDGIPCDGGVFGLVDTGLVGIFTVLQGRRAAGLAGGIGRAMRSWGRGGRAPVP